MMSKTMKPQETNLYMIVILDVALSGIPIFIWLISNDVRELMFSLNPYDPIMPIMTIMSAWSLVIIAFTAFYTSYIEENKAKIDGVKS